MKSGAICLIFPFRRSSVYILAYIAPSTPTRCTFRNSFGASSLLPAPTRHCVHDSSKSPRLPALTCAHDVSNGHLLPHSAHLAQAPLLLAHASAHIGSHSLLLPALTCAHSIFSSISTFRFRSQRLSDPFVWECWSEVFEKSKGTAQTERGR